MKLRKSNSKYNLSAYNFKCPVCERISKNNKCFADHIFHRNWKDEGHKQFAEYLRQKSKDNFLKNARKVCPVCDKKVIRSLGNHFRLLKENEEYRLYLENQTKKILKLFKEGHSTKDIENEKDISLTQSWIWKIIIKNLGKEEAIKISKRIFSAKRKNFWDSFSKEERKEKMKLVYGAEWGNLTPEQRKNHPWVIAGRKASLESIIRGSRNQKYAFELLKVKLPSYNWIYNYAINEDWQIDIAAPKQKIFIEWDGRHHRVNIHGEGYLNNRINRDKIKDKIVTEILDGCMIRIEDNGRFDKVFVENKIGFIVDLLAKNNNLGNRTIHF